MHRHGRILVGIEQGDEPACGEGRAGLVGEHPREAEPGFGGGDRGLGGIDLEPGREADGFAAMRPAGETPALVAERAGEAHQVVAGDVGGGDGAAARGDISGGCTRHHAQITDVQREMTRIRQVAEADRDVDAMLDQIAPFVMELEPGLDTRMALEKGGKDGEDVEPAEGHRRGDGDPAGELAAFGTDPGLGALEIVEKQAIGNYVLFREHVTRGPASDGSELVAPFDVVAVYSFEGDKCSRVEFIR